MKRILIGAILPIILVVTGIGLVVLLQPQQPAEKALPGYNAAELIAYLPLAQVAQVRALGEEPLNLSVHGTVEPFRELQLASEVSGRIVEKHPSVQSGNNVKKGQVLYRIDPRDYELEVERLTRRLDQEDAMLPELDQDIENSRKLLEVAQQELELATASVGRLENLKSNFSSAEELDQAKRNRLASMNQEVNLQNQIRSFQTKKNRLESAAKLAETELSKAKLNLERTVIRAPVDGRVVREQVEADSYVQKGNLLLVLEDTEKIEVACSMRMDQLSWLLEQPEISSDELVNAMQGSRYELPPTPVDVCFEIAGRAGESLIWNGVLDRFDGNGLDPQSRTVPIRIRVDEPTEYRSCNGEPVGSLGPNTLVRGMFVNAVIKARPTTQLMLIPKLAIKPAFEANGSNLNVVWKFASAKDNDAWQESEMAEQSKAAQVEGQKSDDAERSKNDTRKPILDIAEWQTGHLQIVKDVRLVVPYWDDSDGVEYWVCEVPLNELGPGDFVITNPLPGVKADGSDAIRFKKETTTGQDQGLAGTTKENGQS